MAEAPDESHQLLRTFAHLGNDGSATPLPVTETFFADLTGGKFGSLGPGRLVSAYEFSEDWGSWEVHPAGDELVLLVSGAIEFVLDLPDGHATTLLSDPGAFVIVPRGTWHTARVRTPSMALFVTPGEGTQHRPV